MFSQTLGKVQSCVLSDTLTDTPKTSKNYIKIISCSSADDSFKLAGPWLQSLPLVPPSSRVRECYTDIFTPTRVLKSESDDWNTCSSRVREHKPHINLLDPLCRILRGCSSFSMIDIYYLFRSLLYFHIFFFLYSYFPLNSLSLLPCLIPWARRYEVKGRVSSCSRG